jgi:hypothetical protein
MQIKFTRTVFTHVRKSGYKMERFYVSLTVHLGIIPVNNQLDAQFFFSYMFVSIFYMFRATSCSSSGESIVSIQLLVYVTLCRWPSGMQVRKELLPDLHTRRPHQTLYWYNWFSRWWARGCAKHVQEWNKHTKKKGIVRQVGHLLELKWKE